MQTKSGRYQRDTTVPIRSFMVAFFLAVGTFSILYDTPAQAQQCGGSWAPDRATCEPVEWANRATVWDPDGPGPQPPTLVVCADGGWNEPPGRVLMWTNNDWTPLATEVDELPFAAFDFNGSLVVGGKFSSIGGTACRNVAMWNGQEWLPLGEGIDGFVHNFIVFQGELYALAEPEFFDVPTPAMLRWDGTEWHPIVQLATGDGFNCLIEYQGKLLIGGQFDRLNGVPHRNLAMWDGQSWQPFGSGAPLSVSSLGYFNGDLYVALWDYGTTSTSRLMKWDGSQLQEFPSNLAIQSGSNKNIMSILEFQGQLYASGLFTSINGVACNGMARWDGTQWHASPVPSSTGGKRLLHYDGKLAVITGSFVDSGRLPMGWALSWDGNEVRRYARGAQGYVHCLHSSGGQLFAGGQVRAIDRSFTPHIAKWDGSNWVPVGEGVRTYVNTITSVGTNLYAAGMYYTSIGERRDEVSRWNGSTWTTLTTLSTTDRIESAAEFNGQLVIGGTIRADFGSTYSVVRWNGTFWIPLGGPPAGTASALFRAADGSLLAGGYFSSTSVARWDGARWTALGSRFGWVSSLAEYRGDLIAGGAFSFEGEPWHPCVAKWNGTQWEPLGENMVTLDGGDVLRLEVFDGDLYALGWFPGMGGTHVSNIARWDGSRWWPVSTGVNDFVLGSATHNGKLYLGGQFTIAGSEYTGHLTTIVAGCSADIDDGTGTGTCDGGVDVSDLLFFLLAFEQGDVVADMSSPSGTDTPDGGVTIDDLLYYLERFQRGC